MRRTLFTSLLALFVLILAAPLGAALAEPPDQKAAMEAWAKAGAPGPMHAFLAQFEGKWKAEITSYDNPGQPPVKSEGAGESRMIYGGRYLADELTGQMMGQPYEGRGITGYDNVKKQFVSTWIDNMSTAILVMTCAADPAGKVMRCQGTYDDPLTGKTFAMRSETRIEGPARHVMRIYGDTPQAKDVLMLEVVYTRP